MTAEPDTAPTPAPQHRRHAPDRPPWYLNWKLACGFLCWVVVVMLAAMMVAAGIEAMVR